MKGKSSAHHASPITGTQSLELRGGEARARDEAVAGRVVRDPALGERIEDPVAGDPRPRKPREQLDERERRHRQRHRQGVQAERDRREAAARKRRDAYFFTTGDAGCSFTTSVKTSGRA